MRFIGFPEEGVFFGFVLWTFGGVADAVVPLGAFAIEEVGELGDGLAATGSGDDFLEGDDVVGFEDVGDEVEFLFGFGFAEVADVPGEDGDGGLGEGDD